MGQIAILLNITVIRMVLLRDQFIRVLVDVAMEHVIVDQLVILRVMQMNVRNVEMVNVFLHVSSVLSFATMGNALGEYVMIQMEEIMSLYKELLLLILLEEGQIHVLVVTGYMSIIVIQTSIHIL